MASYLVKSVKRVCLTALLRSYFRLIWERMRISLSSSHVFDRVVASRTLGLPFILLHRGIVRNAD